MQFNGGVDKDDNESSRLFDKGLDYYNKVQKMENSKYKM